MAKQTYPEWLKAEFGDLIGKLDIDDDHRRFMKSRWLDQLAWLEGKAVGAQRRYYALRLITLVGALLIPALVSINFAGDRYDTAVRVATWVVSLVVAVSAAIEQFFRYGDRWRNYRRTAERMKTEGWLYIQLSGPYAEDGVSHSSAYPAFALRVEELIQSDVDTYLTQIAVEKEEKKQEKKEAPKP